MNQAEVTAAVIALHNPNAREQQMVYSVWEDGEITLEKGAELFGQRTMYVTQVGVRAELALPTDSLPIKNAAHSRIFCESDVEANQAHALIVGWAKHMKEFNHV